MRVIVILLVSLITLAAVGADTSEIRVWTGKNGKTIRGRLMYPNEGDRTVQILTLSGKSYLVEFDNLSEDDQAFVKAAILKEKQEEKERTAKPSPEPRAEPEVAAVEHPMRQWQVFGDAPFLARFTKTSIDGKLIQVIDEKGLEKTIAIAHLRAADREWLASIRPSRIEASETQRAKGEGAFTGFKPMPEFDRLRIPVINQGDFGSKASDCVPSSFCNFLLWWDREGYLKIPKRGDFEDKADWVHTRVARYCGTRNNSGTYTDDATEGFLKYFTKDIEDLATLKIHIDHDIQPENLAQYTIGDQATMLAMTIRQPPSHDGGHWVALVDAKPDGSIIFNTWGTQFRGKIQVLEESDETLRRDGQTVSKTSYRIEITNQDDLPEWFRNSERELILDPENWDYLYIVRPYVYATEGKPIAAPVDPMVDGL